MAPPKKSFTKKQNDQLAELTQLPQLPKVELLQKRVQESPPVPYVPNIVSHSVVPLESVINLLDEEPTDTVVTKVSIAESILEASVKVHLTIFERAVMEAALSEFVAGNNQFTTSMLFRVMTGQSSGSNYVSKDMQKAVDEAMTKLMYTPIRVDMKQFSSSLNNIDGSVVWDGPIIPAERVTANISGNDCAGYLITGIPIVYRIAALTYSLSLPPANLMEIESIRNTRRNVEILNVLQHKVGPILYPIGKPYEQATPLEIPYAVIYQTNETDLDESNDSYIRLFRKRTRETVHKILDSWKEREFIEDWKDVSRKREIVAVRIYFLKHQPNQTDFQTIID